MAPRIIQGPAAVRALLGTELGVGPWHVVSQADVDAFAQLTGDHQWIHVDVERAQASAFGGTIAHGYYTLSLGAGLAEELYTFEGFAHALNYGLDRVRFPAPLPVGDSVRLRVTATSAQEVAGEAIQLALRWTFERRGAEKPVCVADLLIRLYPEPDASARAA